MIANAIDITIDLCRQALNQAEMTPRQIDEIVLIGGCSRIPLVARRLEHTFRRPIRRDAPDTCVAAGAAIVAARRPQGQAGTYPSA